jgi:protein-tyrosine phosphatase
MAALLRTIVAGPRARHPETGLDLCYVTDNIIATSGPSSTYPQRAYRNPTDQLVKFLDYKHGDNWAIWEFRAEGTGYPDSEVYNRIHHYPWPDHHPPPFALIPNIMASARDWLKDPGHKERVLVVHCKAGKGRSGTVACSYLISEEGWTVDDALMRFTARRMRSNFGAGVSIPSQLRWVGYVDWWTKHGKIYVERQIEVLEVHVWGLRDGVKVAVEGFVDEGKTIKTFHTFSGHERMAMDANPKGPDRPNFSDHLHEKKLPLHQTKAQAASRSSENTATSTALEPGASTVIFRPSQTLVLPTSDINIDFERRNRATYGFTMVTSVAHVWFNAFFESQHSSTSSHDFTNPPTEKVDPPVNSAIPDSGVFEITWEAMDGIKGSARKGTRALDRLAVVWRAGPDTNNGLTKLITEPARGEPVPESMPADWKNANKDSIASLGKDLGLRVESPASASVSKASSATDLSGMAGKASDNDSEAGIRSHGPDGEEHFEHPEQPKVSISEPSPMDHSKLRPQTDGPAVDLGLEKVKSPSHSPGMVSEFGRGKIMGVMDKKHATGMKDLPTSQEHIPGQIVKEESESKDV